MTFVNSVITAVLTLLGVLLGGYLSLRNQDRLWARDHARQWRDIRLAAYKEFMIAYRQYIWYVIDPAVNITTAPHPRMPSTIMPVFDATGWPHQERFEAASITARLVSGSPEITDGIARLTRDARAVAVLRATCEVDHMPPETLEQQWLAQDTLLNAFKKEVGVTASPPIDA